VVLPPEKIGLIKEITIEFNLLLSTTRVCGVEKGVTRFRLRHERTRVVSRAVG